jgi:soluble lytic murein transglycosylase-like protein
MKIPDISEILKSKIIKIQNRVPVKLKINIKNKSGTDFSSVLNGEYLAPESCAPILNSDIYSNIYPYSSAASPYSANSKNAYPLVSGSYESVYPRLSQSEIQELMPKINLAIEKYSSEYNLDPKLVRAVIKNESGFQPFALSTAGAMGLMQLMPGTAKGLGVTDPYNIDQNIKGGCQYLSYQLKAFDGDLKLALAAYNAGPNAVRKYGGIPPYDQTQKYVKKVLESYNLYLLAGDN